MAEIDLSCDMASAKKELEYLNINKNKIQKRILGGIGTRAKKQVKKNFPRVLTSRTGTLAKSIQSWTEDRGSKLIVAPKRKKGVRDIGYGYMLASGGTIKPKKKPYIRVNIYGSWKTIKQATYPAHDYMDKPVNQYINSFQYKNDLDFLIDREVQKAEQRSKK